MNVIGRNTQGVKLINLGEGDRVIDVAIIDEQPDEESPNASVNGSENGSGNGAVSGASDAT